MEIPALHGNWMDLAIIVVMLLYLWGGWSRGLILGILDLLGFVFSFFAALKFYPAAGSLLIANFSLPKGIANALGFLLCGFLVELFYSSFLHLLMGKVYSKIVAKMKEDKFLSFIFNFDKFLGFIPALGEGIIFTAFILTLLISLPIQGKIKKDIISSKIGGSLVSKTQGTERQLNSIFGQAVNETLTFLTINPNPFAGESVDLGFTQEKVTADQSAEASMFFLVNQEREKKGLKKLEISTALRDLARSYGKDMFAGGYFSHFSKEKLSPFDRMEKAGINYYAAGENLALAPNVFLAHHGLMSSPGHKANILSTEFGKIGIGVIDGGIYGQIYVQEFTN